MRDFRDAKLIAQTLRKACRERNLELTQSESLEIVAKQFNLGNWNVLAAKIAAGNLGSGDNEIAFTETCPVLRIFDEAKAREFYLDFLGFKVDFEHRFEPDLPLYMGISRGPLILHLSEHYGDGNSGAVVFIRMRGLRGFHAEMAAKKYKYARPGIHEQDWGLELQLGDPFGNRFRFSEPVEA